MAVAGATGFAGALAAAIVERHPSLELTAVTARAEAGRALSELYPRYPVTLALKSFDADALAERADAALVGYPHGASAPAVGALRERGMKVVDLSADFRLDRERYERYYQPHEAPELLDEAVYGLTETHRDDVGRGPGGRAGLLSDGGAAGALAAPRPRGRRDRGRQVGRVGGGPRGHPTTHFVSVAENVSPYKVEGHRHRAELEHELGDAIPVTFTPHLLPLDQGLLASCYVTPERPVTAADVEEIFRDAYEAEPFVEMPASRRGCAKCATPTAAASTPLWSRPPAACWCSRPSTTSGRAPPDRRCRT